MKENELERRKRISEGLKRYFKSDEGIIHRNKLSRLQTERMSNYMKFINNNNINNFKDGKETKL